MNIPVMFKAVSLTACVLALSACASSPSNKIGYYELSSGVVNADSLPKKYKLENFDLTLNQKANNPDYPNEQTLEKMFIQKLNQELVAQNKLSQGNGMALDISMQYTRIFSGEAFGYTKAFAASKCAYIATLSLNGKEIASFNDEPMTQTTIMDEQKYVLQNLRKIAEITTFTGDKGSEERDIDTCAKRIVERLPN